ncbi:murein biosynthesis integral membrane protein MurJ [Atopobium sp. oral taxon 810]|uniref:murein biosynthesis integral membrane protein MurJ n=1 Tax=Atopobium sp. oral taxon 810 TaxID=712158 RepID=UPI0003977C81|nr:murein biosynthesis integral membrane protein MurJ [Atopobium sp. oral taxon 810]ERI04351.1 putative integral membrane protein MviN [Atopobium sp. oral taxon 810 str. F0209]
MAAKHLRQTSATELARRARQNQATLPPAHMALGKQDMRVTTAADAAADVAKQNPADSISTEIAVGRSAALMSVLVAISRITGFFRTWAQAFALGTSLLSSCYTVANNLPNQLYELVIGGMIVTAFLPVYLSVKERSGREGANAYVSNLLSIVFLLMAALTLLCIGFAGQLVYLQSAGTDQAQMTNAVWLFRFFAVEVLLYCLSSVASGVLNAERDYLWSNAAPIFNNFITIASFLLFAALQSTNLPLAMLVLALGNPLGVLVQVVMQIPSLRRHGVHLSWHIDLHDPALKETLAIGVPTLITTGCAFVTVSVMNSYALMALPDQGSSVQYYARLWYTLPYSVLAIPVTTAMFTELSDMYARHDMTSYVRAFTKGAGQILFTLLPFMMYLIVFAGPLMQLLRLGAFDSESANITAYYLRFLALALPFFGLSTFFQKVFSSMRRMLSFALVNVAASVVQVAFTALLTPIISIAAVALGSAAFYFFIDLLAFVLLRRELGHIGIRELLGATVWSMVLGAIGAAVGYFANVQLVALGLAGSLVRTLVALAISGILAVLVTFGAAIIFKLPQVSFLRQLLGKFFHRRS